MRVEIQFDKLMKISLPSSEERICLKVQGDRLRDVLSALDDVFSAHCVKSVWNRGKKRFRGPVLIIVDGKILKDENEIIKDGKVIKIKRFLVGG